MDRPELFVSCPAIFEDPGTIGVILTSTFLSGDNDGGDPVVGGIRSGRGGVLGVHFASGDPSFGGVLVNASLSVSAMMRFISCLKRSLSCFNQQDVGSGALYDRSNRFPS